MEGGCIAVDKTTPLSRRQFLRRSLALGAGAALCPSLAESVLAAPSNLKPAKYWDPLEEGKVQCLLCPRKDIIAPGKTGHCRDRLNKGGKLYTLAYGNPCAVHIDPVEKTPIAHVEPGTKAFAFAVAGCTLHCKWCQNWQISQANPTETKNYDLSPEDIVARAKRGGCKSIVFSYTEPTMFFEYMVDTAKIAQQNGLRAILKTCGYINEEPLAELCKNLDAANVDIKGFSEDFYRDYCGASLSPVLATIKRMKAAGLWVEITNLLIGGANTDKAMLVKLCDWIKCNVGTATPLHLSRFFPAYRLANVPPLSLTTLEWARDLALKMGLKYVYIGNVPGHEGENTYCPRCSRMVLRRVGHFLIDEWLDKGRCKHCSQKIEGLWWS